MLRAVTVLGLTCMFRKLSIEKKKERKKKEYQKIKQIFLKGAHGAETRRISGV